mgnify:FL=1
MTVEEAAWLLKCSPEDIHALGRYRLLKPIGNPPPNGKKLYRTKELIERADDPTWITKITNAIYKRWRDKNASRSTNGNAPASRFARLSQVEHP